MTEQNQEKSKEDLFKEFIYSLAAADAVADRAANTLDTYGPYVAHVVRETWTALQGMPLMFFAGHIGMAAHVELEPVQRAIQRARCINCRIASIRWKLVAHISSLDDVQPPAPDLLAAELALGIAEQGSDDAFNGFVDSVLQKDLLEKVVKPASPGAPADPTTGRF